VFEAGFPRVRQAARQRGTDPSDMVDGAPRDARHVSSARWISIERHLSFLASTGSVSPYVGLFGTVWGSCTRSAACRSPAGDPRPGRPRIAEALVATAIGLFAAIPAVVAYNRYSHDIERLANRFESFMEEFSNILHRQAVK